MPVHSRWWITFCAYVALNSVTYAQAPTATIGVRAYVPPACSTSTLDYGVLNFGTHGSLDSLIHVTSTEGAGTIQVTCVEGLSYSIELDRGLNADGEQRYMRSAANEKVRYQLFSNPQLTDLWVPDTPINKVGTGLVQHIPLYGRVPRQTTPSVGAYSDTVSVTVKW
jgi:spore coat protein U-like protein